MADNTGPAWGYKMENGEVVSKLFPDGLPARGWSDTPANVKKAKPRANDA